MHSPSLLEVLECFPHCLGYIWHHITGISRKSASHQHHPEFGESKVWDQRIWDSGIAQATLWVQNVENAHHTILDPTVTTFCDSTTTTCHNQGTCDPNDGSCCCEAHFTGLKWELCATHNFGPECDNIL